jgi:hypothetical protein
MKHLRVVFSLMVLATVFGAGVVTQTSFAQEEAAAKCDCYYPNSGAKGVLRWWYGEYTCHVEECWLPLP